MAGTYVSALYTYPVKSCGGIRHEQIDLGTRGLKFDRQWMVVDQTNKFVTQRECPRLALVQTALSAESLTLSHPIFHRYRCRSRNTRPPNMKSWSGRILAWESTKGMQSRSGFPAC